MSVTATSRPASTTYGRRTTCDRCGIEHRGKRGLCVDCRDVEHPKPCSKGHEKTERNVYIPPTTGQPQCGACKRTSRNTQAGWEWSCQACGCRADQGEVLCRTCGQTPELQPRSDRISGTDKTPATAQTVPGRGPLVRSGHDR